MTLALQALPSAVIVFDSRHRLVLANQRMLALAGVDQRWLAPDTPLQDVVRLFALRGIYGPGDPEKQIAELVKLDRTRATRRMLRHADGTTLEMRVQPMADGGFLDCLTDMSALSGPLETAMEDLRRLEAVFARLNQGVATFAQDRLVLHNPSYPRLTGLPAAQVRPGLSVLELFDKLAERGEFSAEERDAFTAQRATRDPGRRHTLERTRPNGMRLRLEVTPMPDDALLYEFSDVTAERRAQEDASRRAMVLDTVLETLPVGVVVWGPDRRARLVNSAYNEIMTGSQVAVGDEMATVLLGRALAGEFGEGDPHAQVRAILEGVHLPNASLRRRPDGRIVAFRPEQLRGGGQVVVVSDVTPLHQAQAEATARADMLRAMLEGMRHGIALFDGSGMVLAANRLAAELTGLTPEQFAPGVTLGGLRVHQVASGEFGGADMTAEFTSARPPEPDQAPARYTRTRPDGTIIEVRTDRVPGGGFVRTYSDITELRRAQDQLSTMLEGMRHGVALFSEDGTLLAVNSLTRKLTGLEDPVHKSGDRLGDILGGLADLEKNQAPGERAAFLERAGARGLKPGRYIRRTVTGLVLEVVTDRLPGGGFVRTLTDVSALHAAEARAQARARMLETMLESIRHGLIMYGPDKRLIAANRLASQMSGVPELPRRTDLTLAGVTAAQRANGSFGEGENAEALERWFNNLDRSRPQAFQRLLPDGRIFEVVSDPTADGGFVVTVSDVSQLVAAEANAKRRAELLGAMLENIRHGIGLFDAKGQVLAANRQFTELMELPAELVAPGSLHRDFVAELLARGEFGEGEAAAAIASGLVGRDWTQHYRNVLTRPNGRVVEAVSKPIEGGGFVLTLTDITEERQVSDELERARDAAEAANAAKSRFLATMSHELRTPLTAVIGFAETLQNRPDAPARGEYLQSICDAGHHLLSLINDILDVARAEQGGLAMQDEDVDVAALVQGVARVMTVDAARASLSLTAELPQALPRLRGDAVRLRQVLLNLLANAIKFTPAGGLVRITATLEPEGAMVLSVIDTGIGMEEADIPRAFEPFNQLDSSLSRRFSGSGLGLHLSRALAEAQGAELILRSSPGQGTTAMLRFPPQRLLSATSQESTPA